MNIDYHYIILSANINNSITLNNQPMEDQI